MSWSVGEIAALSKKAARGAGLPWGLAEEAAWSVRWLCTHGLPGPEALALALTSKDGACPLATGAAMLDAGELALPTCLVDVRAPLLILPFLSQMTPEGDAWLVSANDITFAVGGLGTDLSGALPERVDLWLQGPCALPDMRDPVSRVAHVDKDALASLQALAMRTYAPATELSRAKGAGAGLTDND